MVNFGERIKELRTENHLTQKQVATRLGVAISAVSSYESGNRYPSYEVLIKYSRIFHVSIDYLLGVNKGKSIDVSDLNAEEIQAIVQLINIIRKS